MSDATQICADISANFTNIAHLLECKYRHLFTSEVFPKELQFSADTRYLVEILHAMSPIWFAVRIHKYKDSNGNWCDWNSVELFDEFSARLNEFYINSFVPIENISVADRSLLHVVRKGNKFMRCTILNTK